MRSLPGLQIVEIDVLPVAGIVDDAAAAQAPAGERDRVGRRAGVEPDRVEGNVDAVDGRASRRAELGDRTVSVRDRGGSPVGGSAAVGGTGTVGPGLATATGDRQVPASRIDVETAAALIRRRLPAPLYSTTCISLSPERRSDRRRFATARLPVNCIAP